MPQPGAFCRAFDEAGNVGNHKAALGIAAMLLMAYLVIWIILSCVDTALLVGSFVLLLLLAILMFLTRKLNRPETDGELTITNRP